MVKFVVYFCSRFTTQTHLLCFATFYFYLGFKAKEFRVDFFFVLIESALNMENTLADLARKSSCFGPVGSGSGSNGLLAEEI